jgi:hypothetical protein
MALPQTMLLPVLDTCALLAEACYLVKHGHQHDKITRLAGTGRANPYVAAHVPGEIEEHLGKVAADYQVSEREVRALLWQQILPAARVVHLEIRDHLAPQTKHILRFDAHLEPRHRGDPDDAPTMALAEFLAPCVVITQDSVFSRFGLAVINWIPAAQGLLRMAGLEASAADALVLIDIAMNLLGTGIKALTDLVAQHPLLSTAVLGSALWFCQQKGYLRGPEWRRRVERLWEIAEPIAEKGGAAMLEHQQLRDSLIVVEPPSYPTDEQLAARHLARCGRWLTPAELRDALAARGYHVPAAALKRAMTGHHAFVQAPGDVWTVGTSLRRTL